MTRQHESFAQTSTRTDIILVPQASCDQMASILEQYRISDFLEWHDQKKLNLNPDFQRGAVWSPPARSYLIDTILRQLPIPKVFLRTVVNRETKKTIREVVDGQQRLRTIIDFANDKFALTVRAGEFAGLKYSTMPDDLQEIFLSYPIAVDQLLNAGTDDVLEVFARLNSYSVALNPPEKRHAKYSGELKWTIRSLSREFAEFWEKHEILSVRQRVRMLDDSLTAEMLQIVMEGVRDGGQPNIDKFYQRHDEEFVQESNIFVERTRESVEFIEKNFANYLSGTRILQPPHLLMLFAAVSKTLHGIPDGDLDPAPEVPKGALEDLDQARDNLLQLAGILDADEAPSGDHSSFWRSSSSSTQRIASRKVRYPVYLKALANTKI